MSTTATDVWNAMSFAWQAAFEEAWSSFRAGSLGIGAVLIDPVLDPALEEVVAAGRNRVSETSTAPRTLSGNFMAHAEMNAFAAMDRFKADGLHLYTTLEPCLMCAASAVFLHVERVHFAAADEFFEGVHDLWDHHPYSRRWKPEVIGPLDGPMAGFARVLPLAAQAATAPDGPVMTLANERTPDIAALAQQLADDGTLRAISAADGSVFDALTELWPRLPG